MGIVIPMGDLEQMQKTKMMEMKGNRHGQDTKYAELMEAGKEYEEEFLEKYGDVIAKAPKGMIRGMAYYLNQMEQLIFQIFRLPSWDDRFDAYFDFSHLLLDCFDPLYSDFCEMHKKDIKGERIFTVPEIEENRFDTVLINAIAEIEWNLKSAHKNAAEVIESVSVFYEITWAMDAYFVERL